MSDPPEGATNGIQGFAHLIDLALEAAGGLVLLGAFVVYVVKMIRRRHIVLYRDTALLPTKIRRWMWDEPDD